MNGKNAKNSSYYGFIQERQKAPWPDSLKCIILKTKYLCGLNRNNKNWNMDHCP